MIPLVGDAIPGQGLLSELDRDLLLSYPDRGWLVGESAFAVQAPVTEPHVALLIDATGAEDRGEAAGELLVAEDVALDPVQHLGRAAPTILPLQVGPVFLSVEVVDPGGMALEELLPGLSSLEVVVGHPPLDVEVRLDIGLPGLPALDLLLLDPEGGVDRQGALRLEDAPAVAHDRLGCAVLGDGREQHAQEGRLILGPGDGAADDEAAVVV